jgi:hypothetical protein
MSLSNPEQFTEAYSKADGELHEVPVHWLGSDSPFPGQFVKTKPASSDAGDNKTAGQSAKKEG